jgi:asparagine synthase (glutamine-hydrolysing)
MCGIAGMLAADGAVRHAARPLNAMLLGLRHRGPDDEGAWISPDGQAGFSHTRLAILDLTAAGHQPMQSRDGRLTIAYNGEILNFRELRRALEQRGVTFHTRTDTEVVLAAYELDGPACITSLRGMFAMAIWDARDRSCVLARDRFGIKPLYYHCDGARLTFASEVKALLASGVVPSDIDPQGAFGYFLTGTVPEPHTLLREVKSLEAGTYVTWRDGTLSSRRYWDLRFDERPADRPVEIARAALVDSVAHHFVSDTPVGIFLSGGIDSTALVALSRDAGHPAVHTFSLSFPGEPGDEGGIARQTAAHFGTTHAEWAIDAATGRQLFDGFLRASDQPSIDGLNTFAVSKFAREHGMKVVLSGLGGDELFGGYPSFDLVPRLHAWNRGLSVFGPLRGTIGRQLERSASDPRVRRFGDLLTQPLDLARTYQTVRGVFTHSEARALVERYIGVSPCPSREDASAAGHDDPTVRDAISRLELSRFMRNQPLRDSDTMSMAWGLELRVPFLDGPLVDAISTIPAAARLQPKKKFLLQAVPEIPSWVAAQPKRGFMFPIQRWLDDEWREMFAEVERDCPVRTETWYRKWCVFVFARWVDQVTRRTIDG